MGVTKAQTESEDLVGRELRSPELSGRGEEEAQIGGFTGRRDSCLKENRYAWRHGRLERRM